MRLRVPRQGQRGQAQRAQGLRRRGRGLPDRRRAGAPRLLLQRQRPARLASPARGSPTSTPTRTTRAPTTRPPVRRSGSRPTAGSPTSCAGVGTGGTISGIGRYLKEQNPDVQVIGADPAGSVYSGGTGRPYLVEGVGEDFWPETYDRTVADRVIEVSDADSFAFTRRLAREEAMLVGGSSGMAAFAARQLAHELAAEGRTDAVIVVLLPDSGRGYLTKVFNDEWLGQYGFATGARGRPPHRRRGAARQVRPAARPRAHAPRRDDRRGRPHPPGVRRQPDARRPRRAADRGRRGRGLGVRAHAPRRALRRPRQAHRPRRGPHVRRRCRRSARPRRPPTRSSCSRRPTRCSSTRTASPSAC